jgi:hypothetical protein
MLDGLHAHNSKYIESSHPLWIFSHILSQLSHSILEIPHVSRIDSCHIPTGVESQHDKIRQPVSNWEGRSVCPDAWHVEKFKP